MSTWCLLHCYSATLAWNQLHSCRSESPTCTKGFHPQSRSNRHMMLNQERLSVIRFSHPQATAPTDLQYSLFLPSPQSVGSMSELHPLVDITL